MSSKWRATVRAVTQLHLDEKNPRLGREYSKKPPREIIQYLFEHDKAMDVAASIAVRGYFPTEPLLTVQEDSKLVVVEGNRRLAALKALLQPGVLDGAPQRQVERLARRMTNTDGIKKVPIIIAPDRRSTDRLLAGRHVGTPVLAWQAENRASFILDKLAEGYDSDELSNDLGFTPQDIQAARLLRTIAEMARSLPLPDEVKAKLENPRVNLFSTLTRIFESTVGRQYMRVELDADHGLRGETTAGEFRKAFTKVVSDIALKKQSSRSLNTNDDIKAYFEGWEPGERPKKSGSFLPNELITSEKATSPSPQRSTKAEPRSKAEWKTVIPSSFKLKYGSDRLVDIRKELCKLTRKGFPNAGAVLLRVFLELSMLDYLERSQQLQPMVQRIEKRLNGKLPHGVPTLKQLAPEFIAIAKAKLTAHEAALVEKAITYNSGAPFTITDLHAFIHSPDMPSERDMLQFWKRTEALFRLMLQEAT